jgi:hypothetical protein
MRALPVFLLLCSLATAQDAALRDRVGQLVGRLDADRGEARDAAEKALLDLGPKILPLLPDPAALKSAEQKARIEKIREALGAAEDDARLAASSVTIRGQGLRLTEALKQLQQQSGNVITDLREQMGEEVTNPQLDLELDKVPFFEALDRVCSGAKLAPNFYTGDGTIGLVSAAAMPNAPGNAPPRAMAKPIYTGPFRVLLKQIAISRDFAADTNTANAEFEVAWEPRLRPMLLALKSEDVSIVDDRGQAVPPSVPEESASVAIRPENPVAEVNLNMDAPDRRAQRLTNLKVKALLTLPAGLRAFKFASIDKDDKQTKDQTTVALARVQVEEQVWKLRVTIEFPGEGPALESYQQGLLNNRVWLVRPDGGRLDLGGPHGGGFNTLGGNGGRMMFEYLFVDVPGKTSDYGLIYETPSRITTLPIEFEFHDVPLP